MNNGIVENNNEQWEQLAFVLEERDKPTLIVIGFDTYAARKRIHEQIIQKFSNYKFYDLDISTQSVVSLHKAFLTNLPESVLTSKSGEYIVNVFGLENSLFTIHGNEIIESPLIRQLNFEREILFREFPFITIIWSDSYTVTALKKKAKDLWDWISYQFEFKTESEEQENIYSPNRDMQIFISYAREDIEIAKKLRNDLERNGFRSWMDKEDLLPGQNWKLVARQAIRRSSYFLALLSSKSLSAKGYVHKELKIALDLLEEFPVGRIFIIPVRIDECEPRDEMLEYHRADLFPSYERGLKQILKVLNRYSSSNQSEKKINISGDTENRVLIAGDGNIISLQERYDTLKLDDTLRERVIKEKVNIQKLLGQEYMKLEDYKNAEKAFRLALALAQQIKDFEYEKEEISFLLNQVFYQP